MNTNKIVCRWAAKQALAKLLCGTVAVLSVASAHAIDYSISGVASWNYTADVLYNGTAHNGAVATAIHATTTDASVGAEHQSIWTYCTDFGGALNVPQTVNFDRIAATGELGLDTTVPWGTGGFNNAAFMVSKYGNEASVSAPKAAGLALAVWKSLYDSTGTQTGNFGWNSGKFQVTSVTDQAMLTYANTYLGGLSGADYQAIEAYWLKPNDSKFPLNPGQGLLDPASSLASYSSTVPDAGSSVMLLGVALGGLALLRQVRPQAEAVA